jgi:hypothetical protein
MLSVIHPTPCGYKPKHPRDGLIKDKTRIKSSNIDVDEGTSHIKCVHPKMSDDGDGKRRSVYPRRSLQFASREIS